MGCDIHIIAEKKVDGKWTIVKDITPFDWRSCGMFGFLADVRNYSHVPPLAAQRGYPDNTAFDWEDRSDYHSSSWLSVEELTAFDYDKTFEDRRTMRDGNGAADTGAGNGKITTFREFLGTAFFSDLEKLKMSGAERVVFAFDC